MEWAVVAADVISALAFTSAALLVARRVPSKESGRTWVPHIAFSAAMALYAFVGTSNILEHAGITSYLDLFEDYAELLFVPLLIVAASAEESQARIDERVRASSLMAQQHDLLMNIVDTTPVGIMIVAPSGHITFANNPARHMLRVEEDPVTGMFAHPEWTLFDPEGRPAPLSTLVSDKPVSGVRRILTWPDGRRQQLMFSVSPMNDATATLGGAVIAVEAVTSL